VFNSIQSLSVHKMVCLYLLNFSKEQRIVEVEAVGGSQHADLSSLLRHLCAQPIYPR
jgi:hypothetical protein